jgi:DNA-directed RNA polymerase subunit M/transcription elongation factor TFIIS
VYTFPPLPSYGPEMGHNLCSRNTKTTKNTRKMADIFDNKILCSECSTLMKKTEISKNGFLLRTVACPKCGSQLIHPLDEQVYNKFINLKKREFKVKMRLVGNSYAVSIPKEIVYFIRNQEKIMNDMVRLCFEEMGRLSLNFDEVETKNINNINKNA